MHVLVGMCECVYVCGLTGVGTVAVNTHTHTDANTQTHDHQLRLSSAYGGYRPVCPGGQPQLP